MGFMQKAANMADRSTPWIVGVSCVADKFSMASKGGVLEKPWRLLRTADPEKFCETQAFFLRICEGARSGWHGNRGNNTHC